MSDVVFNIAKGRGVEWYNRVKSNDPAASALVVVALQATGLEADAVLIDYDDLGALLAAANDEATNSGYARKVLTDADLAALPAPDDTNDRYEVAIPNQTWTAVAATGGAWGKLLICYDADTAAGTDANIIPIVALDFTVTPDGNDIVTNFTATSFLRAA